MSYSFDQIWKREGHDAMKWEFPRYEQCSVYSPCEDIIPMWVADMDFATPPCVIDAITKRLAHPILGYFGLPTEYTDAINTWQSTRYGCKETLTRENVMYQNSVLGAVSAFLQAYTLAGESILLNSPMYLGFQLTLKNLGRNICDSALVQDENGIFRMDFEDMEKKIIANKIAVMVFCSPHNPTGRVWEQWEIEKVTELCAKHSVKIISDEIWADFITDKTCKHIPTQSVSETAKQITAAVYAPSKTFNIAGLVGAYSICYNPVMCAKLNAVSAATHYNGANILSCHALIGGYTNGAEWIDEMNTYIRTNQEYVVDYINTNFKGVKAYIPQSTYLLWVDVADCGTPYDELFEKILKTGVLPSTGKQFYSDHHIRLNLACPKSMCEDAMARLATVFEKK